jgi:hypothetical protein
VHSSISSSSDRAPAGPWARTWLLGIVLALSGIGAMEVAWRHRGHDAGVPDGPELWSYHRSQIDRAPEKTVVLIGRSRILTGFWTDTFRERFPGYQLAQLATINQKAIPVLRDLANDDHFNGTVICSIVTSDLCNSAQNATHEYLEYHRGNTSLVSRLHLFLSVNLRRHLVVGSPHVSLRSVWRNWFRTGELPPCREYKTRFDRSKHYDFSRSNLADRRRNVMSHHADREINPDSWLRTAIKVDNLVRRIHDRGGAGRFRPNADHWKAPGSIRKVSTKT